MHPKKEYYHYDIYGLHIISELYIPEYPSFELSSKKSNQHDVIIHFGEFSDIPWHLGNQKGNSFQELNGIKILSLGMMESFIVFDEIGTYYVRHGKEIVINFANKDNPLVKFFLLGQVMARLLHQRQFMLLHASAINTKDGVIAFMGNSGQGKSSMAAVLHSRGHQLVTEDLMVIQLRDKEAYVIPTFPQLKIKEDILDLLGYNKDELTSLMPYTPKWILKKLNFCSISRPLLKVFLLANSSECHVENIVAHEGLFQLMANSWYVRLGHDIEPDKQFMLYTTLKQSIEVHQLYYPRSLEKFEKVAQWIEDNIL